MFLKSKSRLIKIALVLLLISITVYFLFSFTRPYLFAEQISRLNIPYHCKVESYEYQVSDFDGSSFTKIVFKVPESAIGEIENQCTSLKYKHPPILNFSLGEDSAKYMSSSEAVYILYKSYDWNPRGYDFVLFNKDKKKLLVKSVITY